MVLYYLSMTSLESNNFKKSHNHNYTEALDLSFRINIMQQKTMPPKIITRSRNPQNTPTVIRDDIIDLQ